ncbi:MAG: sodium:proton antiporter NhaD [Flavobacteriales bacterium AspAUS03]
MESVVVFVFIMGYLAITLEHPLRLDKTVPALIMATLCWALIALGGLPVFEVNPGLKKLENADMQQLLLHHLGKTAEILIFLIGAMTIVEIVDMHLGFDALKAMVKTRSKRKLLWVLSGLAFFLSAVIDNLTATIVLITLLKKLVTRREDRLYYTGLLVIAANAGGAWSPIGDVTTTMLWIANKVTPLNLIKHIFIPSVLCMVVPTLIVSFLPAFRGNLWMDRSELPDQKFKSSVLMLYLGLGVILFVPVFKTLTNLPPYMGMMFALGLVWMVANYTNPLREKEKIPHRFSVHEALGRIELSSILFFLGILLAVSTLESLGKLFHFAEWINGAVPSREMVVMILGVASAIIDNVPLVAAGIGMFSEPIDHEVWHFIAYAAGTGGSMLIIGSAAGVAAMGIERINFFWYLKKISWLAVLGYLVGCIYIIWLNSAFKSV